MSKAFGQAKEKGNTLFYLKDCSGQPRAPQRTIEGIMRGVRIAFRLIPFVQSVELVGPEDIESDCPIQLQVNIDPRFGKPFAPIFDEPWQPSRDVRFKPFSQYLLTELGRDVDCFAGDSARAREIGRDTKLVYEREPDYFLSDTIEPLFKSAENDAREAARCLEDDFRAMAPNICHYAGEAVLSSLEIAYHAMGGLDVFAPDISNYLENASEARAIRCADLWLRHAAHELDYCMRCVHNGAPLSGLDALCAVVYANEFADELDMAGRPAFWIPVRNPEVIELMRTLEMPRQCR